ncbi:lipopolysaccharide biosynthesis protein [Clostridium prolinivorans]|uniref:lipopolysaccharide biosynthesis protein n=1 Tax=Clostridium prolinivorans TaxID=2769420 RepID=UPI000FD7A080|nr:oligosaccharide flippase family protein [Clostridium prolinivorans]
MEDKSLVKKFISYGVGSIVTLLIGFFTSPIITRLINPNEFGKFSMFTMFTSVVSIVVVCGLDQSFVRFFYEEKEESRSKLLLYSLEIPILINIIFSIIVLLFSSKISFLLFQAESFEMIVLLVINNTILLINRFAILVIRMQQKSKLYSLLQIYQKIAYIIFVLLLVVPFNKDFRTLVYATTFSNLIVTFYAIILEKNFWTNMFLKDIKTKNTKLEIIKYGLPLVFTFLITWLFQSIDRIAIQKYSGFEELGVYSAAFTIISLLNAVQTTFTTFWVPVAYEEYENNSNNKDFFVKVNRIVTVSMFYLGVFLILFKDIIVLLLGSKYRDASYIMPFMIFMPLMYTISETTVLGINFKKKPKYHIFIAGASCLVNIIGNFILVPNLGAKGAAISTGIAYIVFFTMRTLISKKLYNFNYGLVKFFVCTVSMSILALYSSFFTFNIVILFLSLFNIILITVLYFDIIKYYFNEALVTVKKYKNRRQIFP